MARPAGSIKTPSYCHHKATDQAYVTLNGREIYLGTHGSKESRDAYDRIVGEFLASGRHTPQDASGEPSPGMTVSTLLAVFWRHAEKEYPAPDHEPGKRPAGELGNFWDTMKPLKRLYGPTKAQDFGPRALKSLRAEMMKLGWCRNYINRQTSRVKYIFRWAVANELLPASVYHGLIAVTGLREGRSEARETDAVKPVPEHVLAATLEHMGRHVRAIAELQFHTGARPGEICRMRTCDIDTSGKVWLYRPQQHKTRHHGHKRIIRIGKRAQAVLRPFLKRDLAAFIFSPAEAEAERHREQRQQRLTPLTPSQIRRAQQSARRKRQRPPQERYNKDSYARAIARACDQADAWAKGGQIIGIDEWIISAWHPHQLRHNFATTIRRDYGPEAALVLLGDKTTRMVDVYAEKDARTAEQIIAEVG